MYLNSYPISESAQLGTIESRDLNRQQVLSRYPCSPCNEDVKPKDRDLSQPSWVLSMTAFFDETCFQSLIGVNSLAAMQQMAEWLLSESSLPTSEHLPCLGPNVQVSMD